MDDVFDEDHTPKTYQKTGLGLESGVSVLSSSDRRDASIFNLSDQYNERYSQARLSGAGRAVSEVDLCDLLDEEDIGSQVSGLGPI